MVSANSQSVWRKMVDRRNQETLFKTFSSSFNFLTTTYPNLKVWTPVFAHWL